MSLLLTEREAAVPGRSDALLQFSDKAGAGASHCRRQAA
jgi:hypothetical protein